MTWEELFEAYARHQTERHLEARTVICDQRILSAFRAFCERLKLDAPARVRPQDVAAYLRRLEEEPSFRGRSYVRSTIQLRLGRLVRFFRWAHDRDLVFSDPCRQVKLRRLPSSLKTIPTVAEVLLMLSVTDTATPVGQRDQAILELFYATGLRRRECWALDLKDFDRKERVILIRAGKGKKSRLLPVGEQLEVALERYLKSGRPQLEPMPGESALFVASRGRGRRLGYLAYKRLVRGTFLRCGLPPFTPHDLRRAFASHMLEAGADVRAVQAFLGHANVRTTQAYALLRPVAVLREHQRTHPRARKENPPCTT